VLALVVDAAQNILVQASSLVRLLSSHDHLTALSLVRVLVVYDFPKRSRWLGWTQASSHNFRGGRRAPCSGLQGHFGNHNKHYGHMETIKACLLLVPSTVLQ
jgi:hypothetical protein